MNSESTTCSHMGNYPSLCYGHRQSTYHTVHPVSGLIQPPKLSPECGEVLCPTNHGPNLHVLMDLRANCQPKPWPCMHPPYSEFNTQLPPVAAINGLTWKRRSLGDLVRYYKFTLNNSTYLTASTDSCEYRLCAGH